MHDVLQSSRWGVGLPARDEDEFPELTGFNTVTVRELGLGTDG